MRFWRLKDGSSVESYSHDLELPDRIEISEDEFNLWIEVNCGVQSE